MRDGRLRLFYHCLSLNHTIKDLLKSWQELIVLALLLFLSLHQFEVVLSELGLLLSIFADEKTFFTISFNTDLILCKFYGLIYVKLENLDKAIVGDRLRRLKVEAFIQLDLGKQVVNVLGLVVKLISVPFAENTVLVVLHFLADVDEADDQHLEADGTLKVAHATIVLIRGINRAHMIQAMPTRELFNFLLTHTVATHRFLACCAQVHFVTNPSTGAATLVVYVRCFFRCELIHDSLFLYGAPKLIILIS